MKCKFTTQSRVYSSTLSFSKATKAGVSRRFERCVRRLDLSLQHPPRFVIQISSSTKLTFYLPVGTLTLCSFTRLIIAKKAAFATQEMT